MEVIMEIQPINLKDIDKHASNIYEGVIIAAAKARKINDDEKLEFNTLLNTLPSAGMEDDFDDRDNSDKIELSKEFDKRPKPHLRALKQLLNGEIKYRYKEDE